MKKRWTIRKFSQEKAGALHKQLKISLPLCNILVQRGIETFDQAKDFFRPQLSQLHDPFLMKDMEKAVARINSAIERNEKILIFGDYDVDGTTSVALLYRFLKTYYKEENISFYIPHRYREGYGVSYMGINYAESNGFGLIISIDCGIKAVKQVAYAGRKGIDFIICDHHLPDEILPEAVAILNSKQKDCPYPYKELCGCGVGFKLISALAMHRGWPEQTYLQYLDLVVTAIGADIVPITGENRILAYYGLKKLNENPVAGIKALKELSSMQSCYSINNVVFLIAPRVNAAGRMDDATKAVQLFIEDDAGKAKELAEALHTDNSLRKDVDISITEEALAMIGEIEDHHSRSTTVLYRPHWHKGVVGIVASRLIERHYRPTIVLTSRDGTATGSARSVEGYNLYEAIHACREYLTGYGGHFAAAGLTLPLENLEAFTHKFEEVVAGNIGPELLIPEIRIDAKLSFQNLTFSFLNVLNQMEPFGPENMRPVFITRNVRNTPWTQIVKEQHVRFVVECDGKRMKGIGFNLAEKFETLKDFPEWDIVYTLEENVWNDQRELRLHIIDFEKAGEA